MPASANNDQDEKQTVVLKDIGENVNLPMAALKVHVASRRPLRWSFAQRLVVASRTDARSSAEVCIDKDLPETEVQPSNESSGVHDAKVMH